MIFLSLTGYFLYALIVSISTVAELEWSQCLDISTIESYLHGHKLECYGNCKHIIAGVFTSLLCLRECLMFSFCTAVNYNKVTLECQLVSIQGTLQSDMVIAGKDWETVNSSDIPQSLVGRCANHSCDVNQKCVELTSGTRTCVNHGIQLATGLYAPYIPNTEQYHPQQTLDISLYRCTSWTDQGPTTSCPVSRIVDGVYTQASVSCSVADCFTPSVQYIGRVSCTLNGTLCQRWDATSPHTGTFLTGRSDLQNWCRLPDPEDEDRPWCYTTDPDIRWIGCPIQNC